MLPEECFFTCASIKQSVENQGSMSIRFSLRIGLSSTKTASQKGNQEHSMHEHRQSRDHHRGGERSGARSRGGRPPRRGGSSRSSSHRDQNRRSGGQRSDTEMFDRHEKLPEPQSWWQKLLSFLGFGKKKPQRSKRDGASRPERNRQSADQEKRDSRPRRDQESRPPREARPARPPRQPDPIMVTTPRLHVSNLSYDASESDLYELFNGIGKVKNAEVVYDRRTQRSKGFAYVEMLNLEDAKRAVDELNTKEFMGRPLAINGARSQGPQTSESRNADESAAETKADQA
jgi:hypothetical protein